MQRYHIERLMERILEIIKANKELSGVTNKPFHGGTVIRDKHTCWCGCDFGHETQYNITWNNIGERLIIEIPTELLKE